MALSADVRRVVTTIDKNDKAVVLLDGANPHKKVRPHAQTGGATPALISFNMAQFAASGRGAGLRPHKGPRWQLVLSHPPE